MEPNTNRVRVVEGDLASAYARMAADAAREAEAAEWSDALLPDAAEDARFDEDRLGNESV